MQHRSEADEITEWSAIDLSKAIHARRVSCREVMTAYLAQIDTFNPKVNAIVSRPDPEALLKQADQRDEQLQRGESTGWMHGFPQAPKDIASTAGLPTTQGSPILRDNIPSTDAFVVQRMRKAGSIFVGKTNVPEFGLGSHTYNTVFGATGNAFDPTKSAGGSSGGAAVALALHLLPVADGSDMMGSLRNPAGWNNVFSLRPSFGRVPFGPAAETFLNTLAYEGPMGRTMADVSMLLSVMAGYQSEAPLSIDQNPANFALPLGREFKGTRIGWMGNYNGYLPTEPGLMETCRRALKHFETIGCTVEEVQPEFSMERLWSAWRVWRSWLVAGIAGNWYADTKLRALMKPEAIWEIENGLKLSAVDAYKASEDRTAWYQALHKLYHYCPVKS